MQIHVCLVILPDIFRIKREEMWRRLSLRIFPSFLFLPIIALAFLCSTVLFTVAAEGVITFAAPSIVLMAASCLGCLYLVRYIPFRQQANTAMRITSLTFLAALLSLTALGAGAYVSKVVWPGTTAWAVAAPAMVFCFILMVPCVVLSLIVLSPGFDFVCVACLQTGICYA